MRVYILIKDMDYEGKDIIDVYADKNKADKIAKEKNKTKSYSTVEFYVYEYDVIK